MFPNTNCQQYIVCDVAFLVPCAIYIMHWNLLDINIAVVYLPDYISTRAHYSRLRSTIVPSVACQTTEGEYLLLTTLPTY